MNIEQAYLKIKERLNKNIINDNISIDRGRFVLLFNEAQIRLVEFYLGRKNEDDIHYIQGLLVIDKELEKAYSKLNHDNFIIPSDFFMFSNIQIFGFYSGVKDKLFSFEVKQENLEELLQDEFNKPSFKARETFYTIGSNTLNIYKDGFEIPEVYLSYYRYPREVDIEGYQKIDGTLSTNIDPELDDKFVERVLDEITKNFKLNNDQFSSYSIDKDKIINKI